MTTYLLLCLTLFSPSLLTTAHAGVTHEEWVAVQKEFMDTFSDEVATTIEHAKLSMLLEHGVPGAATRCRLTQGNSLACEIGFAPEFLNDDYLTKEGLEVIVCHEMGHLLGRKFGTLEGDIVPLAPEGEADYFLSSSCIAKIWTKSPPSTTMTHQSDLTAITEKCTKKYSDDSVKQNICLKVIDTALTNLIALDERTARHERDYVREYDHSTFDFSGGYSFVRAKTRLKNYPSVPCRYTTVVNGALGLPRPSCWFAEKDD